MIQVYLGTPLFDIETQSLGLLYIKAMHSKAFSAVDAEFGNKIHTADSAAIAQVMLPFIASRKDSTTQQGILAEDASITPLEIGKLSTNELEAIIRKYVEAIGRMSSKGVFMPHSNCQRQNDESYESYFRRLVISGIEDMKRSSESLKKMIRQTITRVDNSAAQYRTVENVIEQSNRPIKALENISQSTSDLLGIVIQETQTNKKIAKYTLVLVILATLAAVVSCGIDIYNRFFSDIRPSVTEEKSLLKSETITEPNSRTVNSGREMEKKAPDAGDTHKKQ